MNLPITLKSVPSFILLGVGALLLGCSDPEYPTPVPSTQEPLNSQILVVNASPDAPALNILVNSVQVGTTLGYLQSFSGYVSTVAGPAQLKGKAATGAIGGTLGTNDLLYRAGATNQTNFSFTGNTSYTVFITDTLAKPKPVVAGGTNPGGPQFLVVTDNLAAPPADSAKIRFLHLAPGAPAVWVNVVEGPTLFANRAYRAVASSGAFSNVKAGTYDLEVRTGSAMGAVLLTVPSVTLDEGKLYTLFARGVPAKMDAQALGVSILQHN